MKRLLLTIVAAAVVPVAACAQTAASSDVTLAQRVAREITEVKGGTTPAEWLRAHASERLQLFNGPQFANDTEQWCARTVVERSTSTDRTWTRSVYFYDPRPPADDALPAPGPSGRQVLETTCQLGLMWIDIPEGNPAAGIKLSEDIQAALAAQYGSSSTTRFGPGGFGSAGWTATQQWRVDSAVLTVAYDQFKGQAHRTLVRLAFANSDAVHDLVKQTEQARIDLKAEIDDLVRRVKETGMPEGATHEMTALLEKPDYFNGQNRPSDIQVVTTFRDWLTTAKSRAAGQQAVALVAGDRVLDFFAHNGVFVGEAARVEMKSMGADNVHNELAGGDVYAHGLLKEAKALAPAGPSADEVLLFQMERGFDETGMCSAGAEEFSQVIQQGESLLAGPVARDPVVGAFHGRRCVCDDRVAVQDDGQRISRSEEIRADGGLSASQGVGALSRRLPPGARDRPGAKSVERGLAISRWPAPDKRKIFLCVRLTEIERSGRQPCAFTPRAAKPTPRNVTVSTEVSRVPVCRQPGR